MASVPEPLQTTRKDLLVRLAEDRVYDLAVVGGGATGAIDQSPLDTT